MNAPAPHLLIVGASGRAAAASAVRAGWQPVVIDLFADDDTRALGPVFQCPLGEYPHGFIALAKRAPPGPWMYTGGLENYPEVVETISEKRELYGVGADVLESVRDPFELAAMLPMPAMRRTGEALDPAKRWLAKPLRGSGGFGIEVVQTSPPSPLSEAERGNRKRIWLPLSASERGPGGEVYAQERVDGSPHSALFLYGRSDVELLGTCAQLVGEPWLNGPPFRYCGNIGPLPTDNAMTAELNRIGDALQPLGLRGLIGVDFIRTGDGIRVLEVNPRYTASVELYERGFGRALLAEHIACFQQTSPPNPLSETERGNRKIHGKAIWYAGRTFEVPPDHAWRGPDFADIPVVGSVIPAGQPVVTLFASADTEPECRERLMELAKESTPR